MNLIITLLLRLSLGVMFINMFLLKIGDASLKGLDFYTQAFDVRNLENFPAGMAGMFTGKLDESLVIPFATVLPWVELTLGAFLLLGFISRTSFVFAAALLAGLFFGQFLLGDQFNCAMIGIYFAASLAGFALISARKSSGGKIIGIDDFFGGKITVE